MDFDAPTLGGAVKVVFLPHLLSQRFFINKKYGKNIIIIHIYPTYIHTSFTFI